MSHTSATFVLSMNKLACICLVCIEIMTSILVTQIRIANAQDTGPGLTSENIEEQLRLAREKNALAEQQGAYSTNESLDSSSFEINIPSEAIEVLASAITKIKNITYDFSIDNGTHDFSFSGNIEVSRK